MDTYEVINQRTGERSGGILKPRSCQLSTAALDDALSKARRNAMAVSLAARGLKTLDGMALEEAYDALEELAWEAAHAVMEVQDTLRAQEMPNPKG